MDLWDRPRSFALAALALLSWDAPNTEPLGEESPGSPPVQRIQWYGTLEQGFAEARRTGRPILLSAASPRCDGVPGKW